MKKGNGTEQDNIYSTSGEEEKEHINTWTTYKKASSKKEQRTRKTS